MGQLQEKQEVLILRGTTGFGQEQSCHCNDRAAGRTRGIHSPESLRYSESPDSRQQGGCGVMDYGNRRGITVEVVNEADVASTFLQMSADAVRPDGGVLGSPETCTVTKSQE